MSEEENDTMRHSKTKQSENKAKGAWAAWLSGQPVSIEKTCFLLLVTTAVCLLPVSAGLRLWDSIPAIVETGIIRFDGTDDSMPRWLVVFGIPGLFCLLNLICHLQLIRGQLHRTPPKAFVRVMGRWGGPLLSTAVSNAAVFGAAKVPIPRGYAAACMIGLAFLLLGSRVTGCPQGAPPLHRVPFPGKEPRAQAGLCRLAAALWTAAGLAFLGCAAAAWGPPPWLFAAAPVLLALPVLCGRFSREKTSDSQF